ncbi:MAG: hypothetical protein E7J49_07140 [Finegoldia magna]|nr:hypothetical protein [Finegoldia magna]
MIIESGLKGLRKGEAKGTERVEGRAEEGEADETRRLEGRSLREEVPKGARVR